MASRAPEEHAAVRDDVFSLLEHTWVAHVALGLGGQSRAYVELYRTVPGGCARLGLRGPDNPEFRTEGQ